MRYFPCLRYAASPAATTTFPRGGIPGSTRLVVKGGEHVSVRFRAGEAAPPDDSLIGTTAVEPPAAVHVGRNGRSWIQLVRVTLERTPGGAHGSGGSSSSCSHRALYLPHLPFTLREYRMQFVDHRLDNSSTFCPLRAVRPPPRLPRCAGMRGDQGARAAGGAGHGPRRG